MKKKPSRHMYPTAVSTLLCIAAIVAPTIAVAKDDIDASNEPNVLEKHFPYEDRVAGWVDNTARSIDAFFGTNEAWRIDNESWLRVTSDFSWDKSEHGEVEIRPRLRLDLPTAKEKLHLLIENDSPEQRSATQEAVPSLNRVDDQRTTVLGLGLDLDSWAKEWKKQFQVGVRGALPIDPYARFIAKRSWRLGGDWELNSYNRAAWFNQDGYSWKSELRVGEPLAADWRLDFVTNLVWREKNDYLEFAESANLVNILSSRSAINYSVGVTGTGADNPEIQSYFIAADYRRNISRRLVFIDVIPVLSFPREEDFDVHWGITVRLELYFQKSISDHD